jgi:hypothetical protein
VASPPPLSKTFSDPDASWGHRSAIFYPQGGCYDYKVHAAVDVATGLPLAWIVQTARTSIIALDNGDYDFLPAKMAF